MKIERNYFRKGTGNQVQSDIQIIVKAKKTDKWNEYQRHEAIKFLDIAKKDIEDLVYQIKQYNHAPR